MSDTDKKLDEIRARHEHDQRWRNGPSMICPHAHDDRGWLLSEIERLRARVAVLERVWEAAQAWREDMTMPTDQIRSGAIGCRLINALAEAKP